MPRQEMGRQQTKSMQITLRGMQVPQHQGVARKAAGSVLLLAIHSTIGAMRRVLTDLGMMGVQADEHHVMGMMMVRNHHVCEHGQYHHQHDTRGQPVSEKMVNSPHL